MRDDIFNEYYLKYNLLGVQTRQAWDFQVHKRLTWMATYKGHFAKLAKDWKDKGETSEGVSHIHFGQLRAAYRFQSAATKYSVKEVAGKTLSEVAQAT